MDLRVGGISLRRRTIVQIAALVLVGAAVLALGLTQPKGQSRTEPSSVVNFPDPTAWPTFSLEQFQDAPPAIISGADAAGIVGLLELAMAGRMLQGDYSTVAWSPDGQYVHIWVKGTSKDNDVIVGMQRVALDLGQTWMVLFGMGREATFPSDALPVSQPSRDLWSVLSLDRSSATAYQFYGLDSGSAGLTTEEMESLINQMCALPPMQAWPGDRIPVLVVSKDREQVILCIERANGTITVVSFERCWWGECAGLVVVAIEDR